MSKADASTGRQRLMALVRRSRRFDAPAANVGRNRPSVTAKSEEAEVLQLREIAVRSLTPHRFRWVLR